MKPHVKVLFVCLGNICRSPTAQAVFTQKVIKAGELERVAIDSAGTAGYHIGEAPDERACEFAARRNYSMKDLRARQVSAEDFDQFDYIIAMDHANLSHLQKERPEGSKAQVELMLSYIDSPTQEVPDPYYGGDQGFETVLDLLENASDALLANVLKSFK